MGTVALLPVSIMHNSIQFMKLLSELVAVSHSLELWRMDCLLHGELCLKLCCLLEAKAEKQEAPPTLDGVAVTFMGYDRAELLSCEQELEKVIAFVKEVHEGGAEEREEEGEEGILKDSMTDLAMFHAECVYTLTRIRVKLASTNLPASECHFRTRIRTSKKGWEFTIP